MDRLQFKDRKILVVGLGRSGRAAFQVLDKLGARLSVYDSKTEESIDGDIKRIVSESGAKAYFGCDPEGPFDMAVLSPGVSPQLPFIQRLKENGTEITGELELAYRICEGSFAAITGTNGKTTTTTLAGRIFGAAFEHTYVGGNIGIPVVLEAFEAPEDAWLVTECSSFQLETVRDFHPHVSALLNLTPDHLNRHKTMENYGQAKANIFKNQTEDDYLVFNCDDKRCAELAEGSRAAAVPFSRRRVLDFGAYVKDGNIIVNDGTEHVICAVSDLKIIGGHNVENVLAASALCYFAGVDEKIISQQVKEFGGVEHRIEFAGEKNGIKFYNDSKGTNTDATVTAVRAIGKDIILLAGGDSKKQDFTPLVNAFDGAVKHLVIYGRDAMQIKQACDGAEFADYTVKKDLADAFSEALRLGEKGDTVLLSPACASWDAYTSFEERGDHFKKLVREYTENENI